MPSFPRSPVGLKLVDAAYFRDFSFPRSSVGMHTEVEHRLFAWVGRPVFGSYAGK